MMTPLSDLADVEASPGGRRFQAGGVAFDLWLCDCSVVRDGIEVLLEPMEFRLLHGLALHYGHFVSNDRCIQILWPDTDREPPAARQTLAVHVSLARKKLGPIGLTIANRYKVGYRLLDTWIGA